MLFQVLLRHEGVEGLLLVYHALMVQYYLGEGVRAVLEDRELLAIGETRRLSHEDQLHSPMHKFLVGTLRIEISRVQGASGKKTTHGARFVDNVPFFTQEIPQVFDLLRYFLDCVTALARIQ